MLKAWPFFLLPVLLQAQTVMGRLYYITASGRAVTLRVLEAGSGRMALGVESGDAGRLCAFVLAHAGEASRVAPGARPLSDSVPATWRSGLGPTDLVQNPTATFWRYAPGQVVPARFQLGGQTWRLLTADLPPGRRF